MSNYITMQRDGQIIVDEKFPSMIGEQLDIQGKLKPVERRLDTLKKHIGQADIYFKYKGRKPGRYKRAFTASCGRNSGNASPAERRIWNGNINRAAGIIKSYPRRSIVFSASFSLSV